MHGARPGLIDPRAAVDPGARLGEGVCVGPFAIVGDGVTVGDRTRIGPHAVLQGSLSVGADCVIHPHAALGGDPQDRKYAGEPTRLEVGDRNVFREFCTMHRGTAQGQGVTRIGSDNLFMAYSHVAHDCVVGDHAIFANSASLSGHCTVGDYVIFGGFAITHQFCRVGAHAFLALGTVLFQDVPPYVTVSGNPARPHGLNAEGLRRRGFTPEEMTHLKQAYRLLYRSGLSLDMALDRIAALAPEDARIAVLERFVREGGHQRGLAR